MTKKEIVKQISERANLTQLKTKEIVQWTFDAIVDTLIQEGRIELRPLTRPWLLPYKLPTCPNRCGNCAHFPDRPRRFRRTSGARVSKRRAS